MFWSPLASVEFHTCRTTHTALNDDHCTVVRPPQRKKQFPHQVCDMIHEGGVLNQAV